MKARASGEGIRQCVCAERAALQPGANNRFDETIAATLNMPVGSEDCLYLNIWAPAHPRADNLPVIVFVHGGSNISGYTADPVAALGGVSGRLISDARLFDIQFNYRPNDPPQIAIEDWIPAVYLPVDTQVTGFNARTDLLNRIFFIASRDHILNALRDQQDELWHYQFDWDEEPYPFNEIYGAAHAFDLPFVFGTFGPSLFSNIANSKANKRGRLALSEAMMRSLGTFARRGDPNDHRVLGVHWPAWPATLHFDATLKKKVITVEE